MNRDDSSSPETSHDPINIDEKSIFIVELIDFLNSYTHPANIPRADANRRNADSPQSPYDTEDQSESDDFVLYDSVIFHDKNLIFALGSMEKIINDPIVFNRESESYQVKTFISVLILLIRKIQLIEDLEQKHNTNVTNQKTAVRVKFNKVAERLYDNCSKNISLCLRALKFYRIAEFINPNKLTLRDVNRLYNTAIKSDVITLKMFLVRYALRPRGMTLLSPIHILNLTLFHLKPLDFSHLIAIEFNLADYCILSKEVENIPRRFTSQEQIQWMVSALPTYKKFYLPRHQASLSQKLQLFCSLLLHFIKLHSLSNNDLLSLVKSGIEAMEEPISSQERRLILQIKDQTGIYEYVNKTKTQVESVPDPVLKGFIYLLIGSYYRHLSFEQNHADPLEAAEYFEKSARTSNTLLFQSAADIYLQYSEFNKAKGVLKEWLPDIRNPDIFYRVLEQIELCEVRHEERVTLAKATAQDDLESAETAKAAVMPPKTKKRNRHRSRKKKDVTISGDPITTVDDELASIVTTSETTASSELAAMASIGSVGAMANPELSENMTTQVTQKLQQVFVTDEVPPQKHVRSIANFLPCVGKIAFEGMNPHIETITDFHNSKEVTTFIGQLYALQNEKGQDKYQQNESEYIYIKKFREQLAKQKAVKPYSYGRTCEEFAWTHIRSVQSMSGLQPILSDKYNNFAKNQLRQAEILLIEALGCYINKKIPVKTQLTPSQLKEIITNFYDEDLRRKQSHYHRTRLLSITSSLGHVHSEAIQFTSPLSEESNEAQTKRKPDTHRLPLRFRRWFLDRSKNLPASTRLP